MGDRAVRKVRSKETSSKHTPGDMSARAGNSGITHRGLVLGREETMR